MAKTIKSFSGQNTGFGVVVYTAPAGKCAVVEGNVVFNDQDFPRFQIDTIIFTLEENQGQMYCSFSGDAALSAIGPAGTSDIIENHISFPAIRVPSGKDLELRDADSYNIIVIE